MSMFGASLSVTVLSENPRVWNFVSSAAAVSFVSFSTKEKRMKLNSVATADQ